MRCTEVLTTLALRRVLACDPQHVSTVKGSTWVEDLYASVRDPEQVQSLRRALARSWLAVETFLAGDELNESVPANLAARKELVGPIRSLQEQASLPGSANKDPDARRRCWQTLGAAQEAGLLSCEDLDLLELAEAAAADSSAESDSLLEAEWQQLSRLTEEMERNGYAGMQLLLGLRWRTHEPLLVVLATAFLSQALDQDRDTTEDARLMLTDALAEAGLEELCRLAEALERHGHEIDRLLIGLRPPAVFSATIDPAAAALRLQRGLLHLQSGEEERAIAELSAAIRLDPTCTQALIQRGEAHRRRGDYNLALADYQAAHRLDPTNPRILFNRGMAYWSSGQLDAALTDYTASLQLDPQNTLVYIQRGIAHSEKGDLEAALADFSQALQLDSTSALAYQRRGDIFCRMENFDRAIADYSQVFRLDPFSALTFLKRGEAYRLKGKLDQAIADYSSALKLDPLNLSAYLSRAAAYRERGQHPLALADLNSAMRLDSSDPRIPYQRALAQLALKNYKAALADLDHALELKPDDAEMVYQRGTICQQLGETENALEDFNTALRLNPDFAPAYLNKGSLHLRQDELDSAIANLSKALQLDPELIQGYVDRGNAWLRLGRLDLAVEDCDQALQRDDGLSNAYLIRAGAHAQQGDYELANADCSEALRLEPDNPQAHHLRGLTAIKQGNYQRALVDLTESLRLSPNAARTLFLRGTVYQMLEQHEQALTDFGQAVLYDQQYTVAYCNQRALVNTLKGEPRLALADYAIALKLDPTNLTALSGREQALQALKAPQPPKVRPTTRETSSRPGSAPVVKVAPQQPAATTQPAPTAPPSTPQQTIARRAPVVTQETAVPPGTEASQTVAMPSRSPAAPAHTPPPATRRAQPPQEVPPPQAPQLREAAPQQPPAPQGGPQPLVHEPTPQTPNLPAGDVEEVALELLRDPDDEALNPAGRKGDGQGGQHQNSTAPGANSNNSTSQSQDTQPAGEGPWHARTLREQKNTEVEDRARRWAEMRYRERQNLDQDDDETSHYAGPGADRGPVVRRLFIGLALLVVLGLLGGGAYWLIASGPIKLTAVEAYNAYANDTKAANKRFKGQWVVVTGKVKVYNLDKTTRVFFESPREDSKWGIEMSGLKPADIKELQNGQDVTIKGRFATRNGDEANVVMSNCTRIK